MLEEKMSSGKNELDFKKIEDLKGYNFIIPSYQRGYRWKEQQVEDLLNDILEFAQKDKLESDFYCLQPIVVKPKSSKGNLEIKQKEEVKLASGTIKVQEGDKSVEYVYDKEGKTFVKYNTFEVIDGQQRLTTIFLILKHLQADDQIFSLEYETRENGIGKFLKNTSNNTYEPENDGIDVYHAKTAMKNIETFLKNNEDKKALFKTTLLEKTKVIWYIPEETTGDKENSNSIELFTRINMGKIPLTNSELIRALFIHKTKDLPPEELNAYKIASEWDFIEQQLHNEDFWTFITLGNPFGKKVYINRIEFFFDIIEEQQNGKAKIDDQYSTFRMYNNWIEDGKNSVDNLWQGIKNLYYRFNEWYIDDELYHLIGFVRMHNMKPLPSKDGLLQLANSLRESVFKSKLKELIKTKLIISKEEGAVDLISLNYFDHRNDIKQILILHNIVTYEKMKLRFPFKRFIEEKWDIEHIHSRADSIKPTDMQLWVDFYNDSELSALKKDIDNLSEKEIPEEFKNKFEEFRNKLNSLQESEIEEDFGPDSLSNLTLLDQGTNRSYKNAPFPVKRKEILEKEVSGEIFVPICTKNIFTKSYSADAETTFSVWAIKDRKNYIEEIKNKLYKLLN
jgi:hypothetical protein